MDLPAHLGQRQASADADGTLGPVDHLAVPRCADDMARVVVHAEDVDRRGRPVELGDVDALEDGLVRRHDVTWIAAAEHRVEEPSVRCPVVEPGCGQVRIGLARRLDVMEVERDADARPGHRRSDRVRGRAMREVRVVRRPQCGRPILASRRVPPDAVPEHRDAPRFVERQPVRHAIAEPIGQDARVLGESADDLAVRPAAGVLERLRQVPVEERQPRHDLPLEQPVDEPVVEFQPLRVGRPAARRLDARPRDAEPIRPEAHRLHEVEIIGQAVVVVAGDVAVRAIGDPAGRVRVGVPDARPATVLVEGTLDLVGGRGGAPGKLGRESFGQRTRGDGRGGHVGRCPLFVQADATRMPFRRSRRARDPRRPRPR